MADPICRWRNPFFMTIRELINIIGYKNGSAESIRKEISEEHNGFFKTAYQLAVQLGLYYEKDGFFYVKFTNKPDALEILDYKREWFENYYVPNPYTKGFEEMEPSIIYVELCKILYQEQKAVDWNYAKKSIFKDDIGNDDILINFINDNCLLFEITKEKKIELRVGIEYSDLEFEIYEYTLPSRDDKEGFFKSISLYSSFETSLSNSINTIYYGAPGTGKSYKVDQIIKGLNKQFYERITFHPEFDNASFIGGYKPISEEVEIERDGTIIVENQIKYKFVPQAFTNIYTRAWQDLDNQYYLVIEEINRGNCAEIFGELFQLLDRNSGYTVTPSNELYKHLVKEFGNEDHEGIIKGLQLPPNMVLLATMNTSDQSLFPMDSAFKRRWDWEYIPICYQELDEEGKVNKSINFKIDLGDGTKYSWIKFIELINLNHIKENLSLGMDKCIGNYFVKPEEENNISLKQFINKVIFFLWNDVFKDEENIVFEPNSCYEDFFPINKNGSKKVKELLSRIGFDLEKDNLSNTSNITDLNMAVKPKETYSN